MVWRVVQPVFDRPGRPLNDYSFNSEFSKTKINLSSHLYTHMKNEKTADFKTEPGGTRSCTPIRDGRAGRAYGKPTDLLPGDGVFGVAA